MGLFWHPEVEVLGSNAVAFCRVDTGGTELFYSLNPKYVHAMNNLGNILKERNELLEAEALLLKAVHIQ